MASGNPVKKNVIQKRSSMDFLSEVKVDGRKSFFPSLDDVYPDPNQPRTKFRQLDGQIEEDTQIKLEELAQSIAANGLNQPITVRPHPELPGKWMIVAGERRWRAHCYNRELGLPNFDVVEALVVKNTRPVDIRVVQLAENIDREDLTDLEVASAMKRMLEEYPELQQKDLTKIVGRSKQWVSRMLGLMDPRYSDLIESGCITYAAILESFKTLPELSQRRLAQEATEKGAKITSGMIKRERDMSRVGPAPAAGNQNAGTTAAVSKSGAKASPAPTRSDAGPAPMPTTAMAVQEVRMQLSQLLVLLPVLKKDQPIDASITLDVGALRAAISDLGATPTRDNMMLTTQLLDVLNTRVKSKKK